MRQTCSIAESDIVAVDLQLDSGWRKVLEEGIVMIPTGQGVQGLSRGAYILWGGISQLVRMPDHLHATTNCSTWVWK